MSEPGDGEWGEMIDPIQERIEEEQDRPVRKPLTKYSFKCVPDDRNCEVFEAVPVEDAGGRYLLGTEVESLIHDLRRGLAAVVNDYEVIQGPYKRAFGASYDEPSSLTGAKLLLATLPKEQP